MGLEAAEQIKMRRNLDEVLTKEVLEDLYSKKRLTSREIGKIFQVDKATVIKYVKKYNITVDKKIRSKNRYGKTITKELLWELSINQKLGSETIAEKLGVSPPTILKYLRSCNIKTLLDYNHDNIIGVKFNKLTPRRRLNVDKYGSYIFLCDCECGNITNVSYNYITKSKVMSCGCLTQLRSRNSKNWRGGKYLSGKLWNSLKHNAKNRKLELNFDIQYAEELLEKQKFKCAISGLEIIVPEFYGAYRTNKHRNIASLDRIDNNKGYIKGNVQWVHSDINIMKRHHPQEYFITLCNSITKHQKKVKRQNEN